METGASSQPSLPRQARCHGQIDRDSDEGSDTAHVACSITPYL